MRGKPAKKRKLMPDPKFGSPVVTKLINYVMKNGKKTVAQKIVYGAFDILAEKAKKDPLDVFEEALNNASPIVEVRSRRVGGANYQVPIEVRGDRRLSLAFRWIIGAANDRKGKPMSEKLAEEIILAAKNEGAAVKKKNRCSQNGGIKQSICSFWPIISAKPVNLSMASARKKILVTHIFPHLDEICAFWLFKRFGGKAFENPICRFIPISEKREIDTLYGRPVDSNPDIIHIGIAGGRFDEHVRDGGKRISSATLVRDFLKNKKSYPKNNLTRRAVDMMVDYVAGEDNGETHVTPRSSFRLQSILYGAWMMNGKTDLSVVKFGMRMLDYIFTRLLQDAQFEIDWKKRIEFKTRWGKAAALKTSSSDIDGLVYSQGFALLLTLDPKENYRMFRASPKSSVNLAKTVQYLKKYDPKAHWYLHQSKKLLISGGSLAPNVARSKLSLREMIAAIK